MRPVSVRKSLKLKMVVAVVMISLIAPPFVHACGCLCGTGGLAGIYDVQAENADPVPASCCCAGGCGPADASTEFFEHMEIPSSCETHPVCCCAADTLGDAAEKAVTLTENPRPFSGEWQFQEADISAFIPDSHHRSNRSCFAFQANMTLTHPHIASTVLLI